MEITVTSPMLRITLQRNLDNSLKINSLVQFYSPCNPCPCFSGMRGFMTPRGVPDAPRASRYILKDYVKVRAFCFISSINLTFIYSLYFILLFLICRHLCSRYLRGGKYHRIMSSPFNFAIYPLNCCVNSSKNIRIIVDSIFY